MKNIDANEADLFDLIFINPDFEQLIKALSLQKSKSKVLVVFENDLERNDRFLITRTFPFYFTEIPKQTAVAKVWEKAINAVPHLFQSQKVIYLGPEKKWQLTAGLADRLYKNTYHKKSAVLKKTNPQMFSFLKLPDFEGIVFQEYKLNISRFFIELLKLFKSAGGEVLVHESFHVENKKLVFLHRKIEAKEIVAGKTTLRSAVQLPVTTYPNFALVTKHINSYLLFSEEGGSVVARQIEPAKSYLSANEILEIGKQLFFVEPGEWMQSKQLQTPSEKTLDKILSITGGMFPSTFAGSGMESQYEIGMEQFDLAKQTGISYNQFKPLFYRYGTGISEMTEIAYQYLEETRNPELIWKQAERYYQQKKNMNGCNKMKNPRISGVI